MRRLLSLFFTSFLVFSLAGCEVQVSSDAQEAYAAYTEFINALRACGDDPDYKASANAQECDHNKIWDAIDSQSKQQVADAYATLVRIDRIIKQYFDSIEHKQMRAEAGTDFIKDSEQVITDDDVKNFFFLIFKPEKLVFNANTNSGLQFTGDVVENANLVKIKTHASNQEFTMIHESDNVWRCAIFSSFINNAVAPIYSSETAMREYAKGNLETELKRRATVRDYFNVQIAVRRQNLQQEVEAMQAAQDQAQQGK